MLYTCETVVKQYNSIIIEKRKKEAKTNVSIPMSKNKQTTTSGSTGFLTEQQYHSQIDKTEQLYIPFKNIKQHDLLIF